MHYHFDSRDALLVEALEHSYERAGDTRDAQRGRAPPMERLERIVDSSLPDAAERDDFLLWVELWLRAARQPELRETAARLYERMHEWVAPVLAEIAAVEDVRVGATGPHPRHARRLRRARAVRRPRDDRRARAAARSFIFASTLSDRAGR